MHNHKTLEKIIPTTKNSHAYKNESNPHRTSFQGTQSTLSLYSMYFLFESQEYFLYHIFELTGREVMVYDK